MIGLQILAGVLLVALLGVLYSLPPASCCGRYPNAPMSAKGKHIKEVHHGYLGAIALLPLPWWAQALALIPLIDDLAQHCIHAIGLQPFAKSPLHRLAARLRIIHP